MDVREELEAHYRTLDLPPGAPLAEIKASYRDLVKIWHPDRFASDPRLQQKCQEKLKQINLAYRELDQFLQEADPTVYFPNEAPSEFSRCGLCGKAIPRQDQFCEECGPIYADAASKPPGSRAVPAKSYFSPGNVLLAIAAIWFASHTFDQQGTLGANHILLAVIVIVLFMRIAFR